MPYIGSWIKNAPKASRIMCIWLPELINFYGSTMAGWKNIFHRFQNPNNPTTLFRPAQMWWSYCDTYFSTCIKFSMFINLALTFYLQACCRILLVGAGMLFVGEVPLSFRFWNPAFAEAPSDLSKPENSEAPFRKTFRRGRVCGFGDFGVICWKVLKAGSTALIEQWMPEAEPNRPLFNCF